MVNPDIGDQSVARDMSTGDETDLPIDGNVGYGFRFDVDSLPCELG